LAGVRSELEEEGLPVRVSVAVLDQAILEAASSAGRQRPLTYLLPCWKRIQRLYKGFRKAQEDDPKFTIVQEARRLCVSYCVFAITIPEMFGLVTIRVLVSTFCSLLMRHIGQSGINDGVAGETAPITGGGG
jgi:ubiquitin conjugation factor E4 B